MAARKNRMTRPLKQDSRHIGSDPQQRDTPAVVISGVLIAIVAVIIVIALLIWS